MSHLLDTKDFPVVSFDTDAITTLDEFESFTAAWASLQERGEPYVTIALGSHAEDQRPDLARARAQFFKLHGEHLARHCRALLVVVDDPDERARLASQAVKASKAFRLPIEYFPDERQAWVRAWQLVGRRPVRAKAPL